MPITCLFPFIDTVQCKDIQDNPIPELSDTAQVAVALDRQLDSITQIDCTDGAAGEEQFWKKI